MWWRREVKHRTGICHQKEHPDPALGLLLAFLINVTIHTNCSYFHIMAVNQRREAISRFNVRHDSRRSVDMIGAPVVSQSCGRVPRHIVEGIADVIAVAVAAASANVGQSADWAVGDTLCRKGAVAEDADTRRDGPRNNVKVVAEVQVGHECKCDCSSVSHRVGGPGC